MKNLPVETIVIASDISAWEFINDGIIFFAASLFIASFWILSAEYRTEGERKQGIGFGFMGIVFFACWIFSTVTMYIKIGMGW